MAAQQDDAEHLRQAGKTDEPAGPIERANYRQLVDEQCQTSEEQDEIDEQHEPAAQGAGPDFATFRLRDISHSFGDMIFQ